MDTAEKLADDNSEQLFRLYDECGFRAVFAKGYHPKHNKEDDQEKRYKKAKEPVEEGFTAPGYNPPTLSERLNWFSAGGWIGGVVPPGYIFIDVEDTAAIAFIDVICKFRNLQPPINITNRGRQYGFKTDEKIAGASEAFTKSGVSITYRTGGRNYLVLPPTNKRTWVNLEALKNPPVLPDELRPYDGKSIADIVNCLSWQLGVAYREKLLAGYDDIDGAFMSFLIGCKVTHELIHTAYRTLFLQDYDPRRTDTMIERTRRMIEKGEKVIGAGSLIQKLKDAELKKALRFANELQKAAGVWFEPAPWTEPIPLGDYSLLPDFPLEELDDTGREFVRAVSEVAQTDPGLAGTLYLGVLSATAKFTVNLISHRERSNLYLAAILPSGERKTSTLSDIAAPVYEYQLKKQEEMKETIRQAAIKFKILEKRLEKLQKQAANEDDHVKRLGIINDATAIAKEMADNPVPVSPTLVVDDITTEALGLLMAENNEIMAIVSAEGGIFKLIAGYYKDVEGNIDLYLKAHSGEPWSNHRIGRSSQAMRNPSLTMALAVQPDVLDELGRNRQFKGRGLIARFLFSICRSQAGHRDRRTNSLPGSLVGHYRDHIFELMNLVHGFELKLSPDAQAVWNEFYTDIEKEMRPGGVLEYVKNWGSKLPGAVARIAGLLHIATEGAAAIDKSICVNIVNGACVLGCYFKDHALAAFGQMREDSRMQSARKILSYIERHKPEQFKGRDVLRHAYFSSGSMQEIEPGLRILMERGYIREGAKGEYSGKGRPEAMIYEVNPKLNTQENR